MFRFFNPESKPMLVVGKLWDVFVLHLVWVLCCLSVVTFGPATIALYYALLRDAEDVGMYYVKDFFKAFRQNFKQGLGLGLLYLGAGGVLGLALWFYFMQEGAVMALLRAVIVLLTVVYLFSFQYIWALAARFENTTGQLLKNSLLLAIRNLKWTLVMLAVMALVYGVLALGFVPILIFGFGLVVYVDAYILNRIFRPFIRAAQEAEEEPPEP